jgi:S1 RNA binding domain protein
VTEEVQEDSPAPAITPESVAAEVAAAQAGAPAAQTSPAGPPSPGAVVDGTVVGITTFGAFVQLDSGGTGLVHISEIAHEYVRDVNDHLKLNDRVRVKVISVNPNGKFDLSIKQAKEPPPMALRVRRGRRDRQLPEGADPVFEEKLSKFLKVSEERLLDLKRNLEAKRGGKYR